MLTLIMTCNCIIVCSNIISTGTNLWNAGQIDWYSLFNHPPLPSKLKWKKPSVLMSPAEYTLKDWPELAINSRSKKKIQKLLDSCKVKKGNYLLLILNLNSLKLLQIYLLI